MGTREEDILGEAIAGTERELFDGAMDDAGDGDDRSLEEMENAAGEAAGDPEPEGEEAEEAADQTARDAETGKFVAKDEKTDNGKRDDGRVPRGAVLDERQKRQSAEAERDAAKTELSSLSSKLDQMLGRLDAFERRPVQQTEPVKTDSPQPPDIFTDPEGYRKWADQQIEQRVSAVQNSFDARIVDSSLAAAHDTHGAKFESAYKALTSLPTTDPAARALVQRIWKSPNPGSALMRWHQEQETLREVGTDPSAYREKVTEDARKQLMADPEFRKQLLADMQAEARGGQGSRPRTEVRIPRSLNGAPGGRGGSADSGSLDGSDRGIFDSAFAD